MVHEIAQEDVYLMAAGNKERDKNGLEFQNPL
jgi:hypothetical protein